MYEVDLEGAELIQKVLPDHTRIFADAGARIGVDLQQGQRGQAIPEVPLYFLKASSSVIAQGTAIVGNLARATAVWIRESPTVRIDPYSLSDQNIIRVICEERLCLGVIAPSALS